MLLMGPFFHSHLEWSDGDYCTMIPQAGSVSFLYHFSVMHCSAWMSLLLYYSLCL